ncbi:hypothetical protein BGX27_002158 [Mortierella sp. AM989]|nr:hypothetical protein BGX27_002158 [Mortierella sp. AM989]
MNSQTAETQQTCACPEKETGNGTRACAHCSCGKTEWDLHPAAIRKIENEGSPEDVKLLHDLEHKSQRTTNKK